MTAAPADTISVTAVVLGLTVVLADPRALATCDVELNVAGFAVVLRSVRVVRAGRLTITVVMPPTRRPDGTTRPAIELPEELERAIHVAVLDAYNEVDGARARREGRLLRLAPLPALGAYPGG